MRKARFTCGDACEIQRLPERASWLTPSRLFILLSALGSLTVFAFFFFSHGELISKYFWYDDWDTGMDFLNSITYLKGNRPYEQYLTLYPPLANLLFAILYHMVPESITENWGPDFWSNVAIRRTPYDLRTYQSTLMMLLLYVGLSVLFIAILVYCVCRNKGDRTKLGLVLSTTFSLCMLYTYERGNISSLAWVLTLCFLLSYDSKSGLMREFGLIALAIAAGLKLYPALYGLILLRRDRIWQVFRVVIYGILSLVLPLLFFEEGLGGLRIWLDVLFSGKKLIFATTAFDCSAKLLLQVIDSILAAYCGLRLGTSFISILSIALCLLPLISAFLQKELWKRLMGITLAFLLFYNQSAYGLSFLLIPLLLYFRDVDQFRRSDIIYLLGMMLLVINVPLFSDPFTGLPRIIYNQIIFCVLIINCTVDLVKSIANVTHRKDVANATRRGNEKQD